MREKLEGKTKEYAAILKPDGEIIYLGTPQSEQSIYRKLPEKGYARSEEHTSELQSLMRISYAVFCLKKKKDRQKKQNRKNTIQKKKIQNRNKNTNEISSE